MFENSGEKLKTLGYISFALGVICSVITGIILMKEIKLLALLFIVLGFFLSWISVIAIMALADAAIYAKSAYEIAIRSNRNSSSNAVQSSPNTVFCKIPSKTKSAARWTCSCGEENSQNDFYCRSCGKYK